MRLKPLEKDKKYIAVEQVRDFIRTMSMSSFSNSYKIGIIKHADKMNAEAANALLKTLEEPPEHAIFILCTTEPEKLPETVISRCLVIKFAKASMAELIRSLKRVAKAEKLTVKDEALPLIASAADGSFRDAVKLLELVAGTGKVSTETVEAVLGEGVSQIISQLILAVVQKDVETVVALMTDLRERNIHETYFSRRRRHGDWR